MRTRLLLAALALTSATACTQGNEEFDGNDPDPGAEVVDVVRTPGLRGTDTRLDQPLPGASGGTEPQATVPEASPGEDDEPGVPPAGTDGQTTAPTP